MKTYVCTICGYEYSEAAGDENTRIPPGTKWEDVNNDWLCPLCGAPKIAFIEKQETKKPKKENTSTPHGEKGLSFYQMSALCSNLAKGCEKQYKMEQAQLFYELSEYFKSTDTAPENIPIDKIREPVQYDLDAYEDWMDIAKENSDRGALRALVWSEKVTKILSSILLRYGKQKDELLDGKNIFVCEICGFVYIGDSLPAVCPVCKVPNFKMQQISRR
ncbi:MAG: rubredoxin [Eubacteriales bacterium]